MQKTNVAVFMSKYCRYIVCGEILPIRYFGNIAKFIGRFLVLRENVVLC